MLILIFHVGKDCYCCSCEQIIEIVPKVPLKLIPKAPQYLAGLLNYGSEPIPVIDFSMIIAGRPSKNNIDTRIILLKNPSEGQVKNLGLIAEKTNETIDIDPQSFIDSGIQIKNLAFFEGFYNLGNESIQRVNMERFFAALPELHINDKGGTG